MSVRDAISDLKRQPVPWDDLVERRVLNDVHATVRTRPGRGRRRLGIIVAAAVVLLLGGTSTVLATRMSEEPLRATALLGALEVHVQDAPPSPRAAVMALADGSTITLEDAARVETEIQTGDLVRMAHLEGRARYDVAHDPERLFVVHAASYQLQVLGTAFVVELTSERLRVEVQRGSVEVGHPDRSIVLAAGDRIDLPRDPLPPAEAEDEKTPTEGEGAPPGAGRLLARADKARRSGRLRDATRALSLLVQEHSRDARAPSAWFMLGRVRRQLGEHGKAAHAFGRARRAASGGALAEDARAEEALSWKDAGQFARARKAAQAYLERHPDGTHATRLRPLARPPTP